MTRTRALLWLALPGAILAAVPASGAGGADVPEYRYANGFVATGTFAGECGLVGFAFPQEAPGQVRLRHEAATLTVVEVRRDSRRSTPRGSGGLKRGPVNHAARVLK